MNKAPDLWSAFMRFSQKAAVADHISAEPIFCLTDFYFGSAYSWLVTAIGSHPEIASEYYVYNLFVELESLIDLDEEHLLDRLNASPKPVRRLRSNASPIIMPVEDAPAIATAAQLGIGELTRRAEFLRDHEEFRRRLVGAFQATERSRRRRRISNGSFTAYFFAKKMRR